MNAPARFLLVTAILLLAGSLHPASAAVTITRDFKAGSRADSGPSRLPLAAEASKPVATHQPSQTPLLRIETGMHTASIRRVATDAAGRLALTCSHDKTARLWSLPDLKSEISNPKTELLRTFRLPIGSGDEGKLYACALSPDGAVAALAGYTGWDWDGTVSIYLFDTASGQLLRRLGGLPQVISDLAFSPSGQTLAAVLVSGGLRLFDSRSGRFLAQDTDYGAASYGVDWQAERRLVTTCDDGKLRLYTDVDLSGSSSSQSRALKPDHSRSLPQGKESFRARFSPDGRQIAVGFNDSPQIALVSATDLSSLPSPSTRGIASGNLVSVAWSADGRYLAAGGAWDDGSGAFPILLWQVTEGQATGQPQDLPLAQNTIMDLRALPSGGFLWGSADPAWGITTASGSSAKAASHRLGSPPIADYRGLLADFRVSADASVLAFWYWDNKSAASFHLLERRLTLAPSAITTPRSPRTEGLPVTDWNDTVSPKLASQPLKLDTSETSFSLCISPDSSFFLLGTSYWLRSYAKDGSQRWKMPVPGIVWAVNLSADGRLAVAAYGDGTIRWHRTSDGRELLAFFPHADQKRWVLWTPEGYYDCSPGAEDLIGWHLNQGKDKEAIFVRSGQLAEKLRRPDVIQKVAREWRPSEEIAKELGLSFDFNVLRKLPTVTWQGIQVGKRLPNRRQSLELTAGDRGAGVGELVLYLNGTRVLPDGPGKLQGKHLTVPFTLSLTHGSNTLSAVALTPDGLEGEPVNAQVTYEGEVPKSSLWVLAAGVNKYKNPAYNLAFCKEDSVALADALARSQGRLFAKTQVISLADAEVTRAGLRQHLADLAARAKPEDVFVFIFAGHGCMSEGMENPQKKPAYYLVTHEVRQIYGNDVGLADEAISDKELKELCLAIPAGKKLVILDTCHAGSAADVFASRGVAEEKAIATLARASGMAVLAGTRGDQFARALEHQSHGIFTQGLLQALSVAGDGNKDGIISVTEAIQYLNDAVPALAEKHTGTAQYPTSFQYGQDFPLTIPSPD
jgi:WD40 repeat protein